MSVEKGYLNRNIIGLGLTSLLTDISSESVYAVLPFYIRSLGYGTEIIGFVEGLGEFTASIFKFISGYITYKIARFKLLTLIGYSLSTFIKPFFAIARSEWAISIVKALDRLGKGVRTTPRDALITLSSGEKYRGRAFGLHRMMDTIGALTGPLLAVLLLTLYGYIGVFLFSIIPGLLAVLTLLFIVKDVKPDAKGVVEKRGKPRFTIVFWLFISTIILSGLMGYTQAFLLVRARDVGLSEEWAIGTLVLANVIYALLAYPIGYVRDVLKRFNPYPLIFAVGVIGVFSLMVLNDVYAPIIFFSIYGVYMALHDTLTRIMTSVYVSEYLVGLGYGIMHSSYGISSLIGYYVFGWLYQNYGYVTACEYSIFVGLTGLIISCVLIFKTRTRR